MMDSMSEARELADACKAVERWNTLQGYEMGVTATIAFGASIDLRFEFHDDDDNLIADGEGYDEFANIASRLENDWAHAPV